MIGRRVAPVSVLFLVLVLATAAHASSPLILTWKAPAECPTTADVIAQVEARLGNSTAAAPVTATGVVTRIGAESWQVILSTELAGVAGERTLAGPTCAAVTSAAALVLALTIDPQALSPHAAALPPPPRETPRPKPAAIVRVTPAAKHLFARLSAAMGVGVGPNPVNIGGELGFGAVVGRLSVELIVAAFAPESYDSSRAGSGGTFSLVTAGGSVCGAIADGRVGLVRLRLGGCAGMEVAGMHGAAYGVANSETRVAGWGAPTAASFLGVRLAPDVWLHARLDGSVALDRPTFVIQGIGPVFHVNPISGRVAVGIELRF